MERVSCSDSCPGLFSQLKEVYLFGCNTLNAEAVKSASAEVARSLVRSGHSAADAAATRTSAERATCAKATASGCARSSRTCPSSTASRRRRRSGARRRRCSSAILQTGGIGDIATGQPSAKLFGAVCAGVDDRRVRIDRFRPRCGPPARRLPFFGRPALARTEARLRSHAAPARYGRGAHVPRPSGEILAGTRRNDARGGAGLAGARPDQRRQACAGSLLRVHARRRPGVGPGADDRPCRAARLADARREAHRDDRDDRRPACARRRRRAGRRPRLHAQSRARARRHAGSAREGSGRSDARRRSRRCAGVPRQPIGTCARAAGDDERT